MEENFMAEALQEARKAESKGEVPIGAVIVRKGKIIARGHNMRERKRNALAHAEVIAINRACRKLKSWRLDDCEMYVTLQPCPMCAGAILNARIWRVVIGALRPNDESMDIYQNNSLNWKTQVDVELDTECGDILKRFFKNAR